MAVHEWLGRQQPNLYGKGIFKLMPRYNKCMNVYAKKLWNFNKINEVVLEQKSNSDKYVEMRWLLQVHITVTVRTAWIKLWLVNKHCSRQHNPAVINNNFDHIEFKGFEVH